MNSVPIVDVIIPIHDSRRPLERALRSLMTSGLKVGSEVQINVICHNISQTEIAATLPAELSSAVNFLECHDGLPSPAGPRALALDNTGGQFFTFLDSDDTFDPEALASWVSFAEKHTLDAVIPPERHDTGAVIRTPPVRPLRKGNLDGVRDRLSYRTAPLGLIRRSAIEKLGLEFGTDVRNGSDQIFALKLWFGGGAVRYARGKPGYVVGSDAETRVTTEMNPLATELKATNDLLAASWFAGLDVASRRAIVVKFVRIQLFGGIERRLVADIWTPEMIRTAADFLALADRVAPGFAKSFSVAESRMISAIETREPTASEMNLLAKKRRSFGHPATLLTRDLRYLLGMDAPLRYMIATVLH